MSRLIISRLKIPASELVDFTIFRKSIDARKKPEIFFVYTVDAEVKHKAPFLRTKSKDIAPSPDLSYPMVTLGKKKMKKEPVIIGSGPAGLAAGLLLARHGYNPIILERGLDVDTRTSKINKFWLKGQLDTECNVQFGEGGAGTFSDGKLTSLINNSRCHTILKEFIKAGAPPEILYKSKPHVGTDLLKKIVKNIRQEIINYGGHVRFGAKVTDFVIDQGYIQGVIINDDEFLAADILLLAMGHSARDTMEVLWDKGVNIIPKAFAIGLRIEHPQTLINESQYGLAAENPRLGPAEYKLAYHSPQGRSCYSFCMCPGGYVVAAASEARGVVTNGMSYAKREGLNANAALLVGVKPTDFASNHPLAGIEFQRKWERLAYQVGGEGYMAPAQLTGDFLADKASTNYGGVKPTYEPGVSLANLKNCLPDYVVSTLREGILHFDKRIKGFARPDSILTGVETRTSSPIRIKRDERAQSNIKGLYPVGEGAGYAGGIMSSAVDGMKVAEKVMAEYGSVEIRR
ncbi:MAG TPA: FAD-dependent monooxygenase [Syntrophomonadaceae bacterium]|nr:FAD-dependent monooxygenase [Syntrophomonadaceae bacterium]